MSAFEVSFGAEPFEEVSDLHEMRDRFNEACMVGGRKEGKRGRKEGWKAERNSQQRGFRSSYAEILDREEIDDDEVKQDHLSNRTRLLLLTRQPIFKWIDSFPATQPAVSQKMRKLANLIQPHLY